MQQTEIAEKTMSRREEAAETIERIFQATNQTVAEVGAAGASMKQIAMQAGVSKALLHYHFNSKEELLLESLRYLSRDIAGEVLEKVQNQEPSIEVALQAARELYRSLILNHVRVNFITQMYSMAITNKKLRDGLIDYLKLEGEIILDITKAALGPLHEQGYISTERLAGLVQTAIVGMSVESVVRQDSELIESKFEDLLQLLSAALLLPALAQNRE